MTEKEKMEDIDVDVEQVDGKVEEEVVEKETVSDKKPKRSAKKKNYSAKEYEKLVAEKEALVKSNEESEAKANELNDKHLRLLAEFDNFKRRNSQEKLNLAKTANEKLLLELLPVLDSFDQAYVNVSEEDRKHDVFKGLELIHKQVGMFVEKQHLKTIDAVGKPFDPNFHNAISKQDSEEYDSDVVIVECQKGYLSHDKVLRPSMVIVSN